MDTSDARRAGTCFCDGVYEKRNSCFIDAIEEGDVEEQQLINIAERNGG